MKTQVAPRTHTQGSTFSCRKSAPRVGFSISKPPIPFFLLCTPPRCALRCLPCALCSSLRAPRLSVLLPEQPRRGVDFSEREARRRAAARSDAAPYFLIPRPRSALGAEPGALGPGSGPATAGGPGATPPALPRLRCSLFRSGGELLALPRILPSAPGTRGGALAPAHRRPPIFWGSGRETRFSPLHRRLFPRAQRKHAE